MKGTTRETDHLADILDIRDIIARFEQLEEDEQRDEEEETEFRQLESLLDDCRGCGGDEQWRGDWYPVTLIHGRYFVKYAQELAEDCGMVADDARWPNNHIDWEAAADELLQDYTIIDYDGETYYTR